MLKFSKLRYFRLIKPLLILVACLATGLLNAQVDAGVPDDLFECDLNNPGDETEVFDLTETEEQIINGQSNVVVTYHLTSGGALSNINAISNPETYTNIANPEPIFARLQSTAGQGWSVTSFQLIVPKIPVIAEAPDDLFIDDGDGDSFAEFDLTINEAQMLGSADPFDFQFSYFTSMENASNNVNAIADPESYTNITNPQQIYGRYEPLSGLCELELFSFEIQADGPLGTDDFIAEKLMVYPNPASNIVTVKLPVEVQNTLIELFDIDGKLLTTNNYSLGNHKLSLDVSNFARGLYFVKLSNNNQRFTQKLILK